MTLPQKQFSTFRLLFSAMTRRQLTLNEFKPYSICVDNYYVNSNTLNGFEKMFGSVDSHPTFIFNAAFPIVLQCIAQSSIPSSLLGLLHLSTEIKQHHQHNWRMPSEVKVTIEDIVSNDKGLNYKIVTQVHQLQKLTLTNTNWLLDKSRNYKKQTKSNKHGDNSHSRQQVSQYDITQKTALRYALVSKDFNPIHLNGWLAKNLGLKTSVMHGMYNAHKVMSLLSKEINKAKNSHVLIEFNRPCFLPNTAILMLEETEQVSDNAVIEYGLYSEDGKERFLKLNFRH